MPWDISPLSTPPDRWDRGGRAVARSLVRFGDEGEAAFDLVCFPAAGEPAARLGQWRAWLPPEVGLICCERPGRGRRFAEDVCADLSRVADEVVRELTPLARRPMILVGHSAGSLVAHAVDSILERSRGPTPALLVTCHGRSPTVDRPIPWATADDSYLAESLRRRSPATASLLDRSDFREPLLRSLTADLKMYERSAEERYGRVTTPILAVGGINDDLVPPDDVHRWREVAGGGYCSVITDTDHFDPVERPLEFLQTLAPLARSMT